MIGYDPATFNLTDSVSTSQPIGGIRYKVVKVRKGYIGQILVSGSIAYETDPQVDEKSAEKLVKDLVVAKISALFQ